LIKPYCEQLPERKLNWHYDRLRCFVKFGTSDFH
jgi:hypothetical protein